MASIDPTTDPCSVGRAASLIGDKWSLLILRNAMIGRRRFDEFKRGLGIADNILSNRLGRLVEEGLLRKVPYVEAGRTRQEYRLTEAGAALRPVLEAMAAWGHVYAYPSSPTKPVRILHTECGQISDDGQLCSACGRQITNATAAWMMPWISPEPLPLATP